MDLLVPLSTKVVKKPLVEVEQAKDARTTRQPTAKTLQEALEILRTEPNKTTLTDVLNYLISTPEFNKPTPVSAQIVNALANTTVPNFWGVLEHRERLLLSKCLTSVAGLGAVIARLKALISDKNQKKKLPNDSTNNQHVLESLQLLALLLDRDDFLNELWNVNALKTEQPSQKLILWRELLASSASGKIISLAAEAEQYIDALEPDRTWLSRGAVFASWLGRNIALMAKDTQENDQAKRNALAQLLGRSFSLGYSNEIVTDILSSLLSESKIYLRIVQMLLSDLRSHEMRQLFDISLAAITNGLNLKDIPGYETSTLKNQTSELKAAAWLILGFIENTSLRSHIVNIITQGRSILDNSLLLRRATLAALSVHEDEIQEVLDKSMQTLGDQLYIKHTPIIQQEALAQTLLITAGYVHRKTAMHVVVLGRSGHHTHGVSNRLAASSSRARFLGMVVGMAVSELIDKPENRMKFDVEELETDEAKWYRQLIYVDDKTGDFTDAKTCWKNKGSARSNRKEIQVKENKKTLVKPVAPRNIPRVPTGPRIVEVLDEDDSDDLQPYAKPDSDPEDESEDPTLVNRNKPTAPVYIRDLMAGLRDTENHDRYLLAVSHAEDLIRRKSTFGREVTDNWEELASLLVALQDPFEFEDFAGMRQRALTAIILARPTDTGPWFARAFFEGDYSISQRLAIISTLGLGARFLAGFQDEEQYGGLPKLENSFPSKSLPEKMHKLFITPSTPVDSIAQSLERKMVEPMALKAADEMTGPNVLKVRTFSSRIEKEKKRKKPISNELAKIVGESFFFPLTGRWWAQLQSRSSRSIISQPILLQVYLKSLSLLLHASGPSTLSLPQMTSEFWDLLLSVRTIAQGDIAVLEGTLFAFLTLLEVNEDKHRLVQEHAKELLETQEWVKLILESRADGKGEDERIKMLASGVGMKCSEVIEKYQRLLLGDMVDYV